MPSTVQTDMRLHFSTTIFIYFSPATNCMVGAKTLHVNKGSNVASMVKSELLSKDLFGGKWSSEDIEFAIKDLVVPGTGSEKIDLALRPVSSFDENSTYSLGDGVKRPMIRSKQVLVSTDPDKVFSAVSVDLETQKTFGFFQSGIGRALFLGPCILTQTTHQKQYDRWDRKQPDKETVRRVGQKEANPIWKPGDGPRVKGRRKRQTWRTFSPGYFSY